MSEAHRGSEDHPQQQAPLKPSRNHELRSRSSSVATARYNRNEEQWGRRRANGEMGREEREQKTIYNDNCSDSMVASMPQQMTHRS